MLSNKRLVSVCAIALCCNVVVLVLFVKYRAHEHCYATIDEAQTVLAALPDDFLSIGIDTSEIEDFERLDFLHHRFVDLASHLSPGRLRVGGTMSDRLIFSVLPDSKLSCHCHEGNHTGYACSSVKKLCHKFLPYFIMTGKKWDEINGFCNKTNFKLLFSLNLLLRDHHSWDIKNARDLITYSHKHHYNIDWQLGNEPNSFPHVFNMTITPRALAKDYKKLQALLNDTGYHKSWIVGPDTTRPQPQRPECLKYMIEFLDHGSNYINVRSWHQYYLNSRTVKLEDFWDPKTFDLLEGQIETMKNHTKNYSRIPMWLTETSSSYGGGAPGLSNSYAASPLWLDKLGLSAKHNITTVVRQSYFGGNYSLIDSNFEPLPDWWVSVLYKKLVGGKVLSIDCHCSSLQRMYAHCTNKKYTNDTSAITIYAVNLEMAIVKFRLNGTALHGNDLLIDEYIISAPSNNRRTKTVLLNGWPLYYESSLPDIKPRLLKYGNYISMPPYSIGFWVIKNTLIKVCK